MLSLSGKLYNVAANPFTDKETGEISQVHTAEILFSSRGKTEIAALKLDASVFESWKKVEGRDVAVEVGFYAFKTPQGAIQKGMMLMDKKALPTLLRAVPIAAAA